MQKVSLVSFYQEIWKRNILGNRTLREILEVESCQNGRLKRIKIIAREVHWPNTYTRMHEHTQVENLQTKIGFEQLPVVHSEMREFQNKCTRQYANAKLTCFCNFHKMWKIDYWNTYRKVRVNTLVILSENWNYEILESKYTKHHSMN